MPQLLNKVAVFFLRGSCWLSTVTRLRLSHRPPGSTIKPPSAVTLLCQEVSRILKSNALRAASPAGSARDGIGLTRGAGGVAEPVGAGAGCLGPGPLGPRAAASFRQRDGCRAPRDRPTHPEGRAAAQAPCHRPSPVIRARRRPVEVAGLATKIRSKRGLRRESPSPLPRRHAAVTALLHFRHAIGYD
jgi:hypothetical protein